MRCENITAIESGLPVY